MKVFCIIVIHNGMKRNWIEKCLTSLQQSNMPVELIAVDNKSSDNGVEYIKSNFPNVILLESTQNLGFGGANNIGLKKALELGGEFFFLLNQDAWVEPDTIGKLAEQINKNPEYGIISPIHLNGNGDALDLNFSRYVQPDNCKGFYSDFVLGNVKHQVYESDFINAAAWMLSKETLKKVGGFNPVFYHYAEDDNYAQRVHFKRMKIGVIPDAFIYHDREDRPKSDFHKSDSVAKNHVLAHLSNPNNSFSPMRFYVSLFKEIFASLYNLDKERFGLVIDRFATYRKYKTQAGENLKKTKSAEEFVFLH